MWATNRFHSAFVVILKVTRAPMAVIIIDLARILPPEQLPQQEQAIWEEIHDGFDTKGLPKQFPKYNYKLYKLLHPELVKSNEIPLNSDARSRFIARRDKAKRSPRGHQVTLST